MSATESATATEVIEIKSKFYPHEAQQRIQASTARFKLVVAGRRFGKSLFAVNECIETALREPNRKVWYIAPLYRQVKEIAWSILKEYSPKELISKTNESELKIVFLNGSEIALKGSDNPDTLVGVGLHFVVLDESAMMKEETWYNICRPMMIDTRGKALFISTPRGFNWFYDLWVKAQDDTEFDTFHFNTIDNTAVEGIHAEVEKAYKEATTDLEKIIYRQEYEANFESVVGRPRFDLSILNDLMSRAKDTEFTRAGLKIYEYPKKNEIYISGTDTSEGLITGDRSAHVIVDARNYKVVAKYAGKIAPDLLAPNIKNWNSYYNDALAVIEDNNHGLVTLNFLRDIYSNIYYRKVKDETADKWTKKIGWRTTPRTKPMLIAEIDKALRSGLDIKDKEIISELMTYIVEDDGKTNAQEGCKDDLVMALGCAMQGYLEINTYQPPKEEKLPRYCFARGEMEESDYEI